MEIKISDFVNKLLTERFDRKFDFCNEQTPAMGASTSSEPKVSPEQQEAENVASSTGALPILQKAFSKFANSETNAIPLENLQVLLIINFNNFLILNFIDSCSCSLLDKLVVFFSEMLQFRSRRWKLHYRERERFVSGVIGSIRFIFS
jgi:hypothetical protein